MRIVRLFIRYAVSAGLGALIGLVLALTLYSFFYANKTAELNYTVVPQPTESGQ